jgi:hypothetical protein
MKIKIVLIIIIVLLLIYLFYILDKTKTYENYAEIDDIDSIDDLKNMLKEYKTYVIMGIQNAKKITYEKATTIFNDLVSADNPAKYFQKNIPEINVNSLPSSFNSLKEKFNKAINL